MGGDGPSETTAVRQMSSAAREALEGLEFHWGDAYTFSRDDEGTWHARRRDGAGVPLTAGTAGELSRLVRADYAASPVPREYSEDGG